MIFSRILCKTDKKSCFSHCVNPSSHLRTCEGCSISYAKFLLKVLQDSPLFTVFLPVQFSDQLMSSDYMLDAISFSPDPVNDACYRLNIHRLKIDPFKHVLEVG